MRRNTTTLLLPATALCAVFSTMGAGAENFVEGVKRDTRSFCRVRSRLLGSDGHEKIRNDLIERIGRLPGVELVRQSFGVLVPQTRRSTLAVLEGTYAGLHEIHPVWPDTVRLKTTPREGLTGKPVYVGTALYREMSAVSMRGNIAVMEMAAYGSGTWLRAFDFGATSVLLLGSRDDSHYHPSERPIYKPRYYVPEGPFAEALRRGDVSKVRINCDGEWKPETAENLLALLPGTDPSLKPIILAASYDAMSIVPAIAPGADNAVDAAFLLQMLTYLSEHRPKRGVIAAFIDAHGFNLLGMRELLGMLTITPVDATRRAYEEQMREYLGGYESVARQVEELGEDPAIALLQLHDEKKYKLLQRYVKDVLSPERIAVNEEVFALRLAEVKLKGDEAEEASRRKVEKTARQAEIDSMLSGIISKGIIPEGREEECAEVWDAVRNRASRQLRELRARAGIFERNDGLRGSVLAGMRVEGPGRVAFPFVFGIDLSDSGTTVGPSMWCEVLWTSYSRSARQFTRWLTNLLKEEGDPYRRIPQERLDALGLRADGIVEAVGKILNTQSLDAVGIGHELARSLPGVDEDARRRITKSISSLRDREAPLSRETALRIVMQGISDLGATQADKLVTLILNREAIVGGAQELATTVQKTGLLTSVAQSFQTNGVTWGALEGIRPRLDTPQDTLGNLDWSRLEPQIEVTALVIEMLLNDEDFSPEPALAREGTFPKWRMPSGVVVSETVAETIARTPRAGMFVTAYNQHPNHSHLAAGFRGFEFIRSGSDGRFRFRPVPASCNWPGRRRHLTAYGLAPDGRIVRSIAKITSMLAEDRGSVYDLMQTPPLAPLRGDTFECVEVNGPQFRDPRYQAALKGGKVLDVTRGGVPKRYVWANTPGPMLGLLRPDTRYQLILSRGMHNRLVLMNVPEDLNSSGRSLREALRTGFPAGEPLPALPELISARDFYRIDEWRLRRLESAGVIVKAIRRIHKKTEGLLEEAEAAYAADHGGEHKRAATAALANEIRVYQAVQDQANDVTRGSIFLLLLLVPFAIAMERLLFASPEIAKQIGKSMAIFVVMFVILASFHPGFKITSMPAVILIAFMVLLLSVSVINMVLSKFRADMEELRRGTLAEAAGAQTGRGGVIMSAIWLGIANMRKRMVRTLLTGLTIVLVTFSLLCFTSSSTYQDKRIVALDGVEKAHSGLLLQHPSSQSLDFETEESLANMLGQDALVVGRYWVSDWKSPKRPEWRLHVRNPGTNQLAAMKIALGLRSQEDRFTSVRTVLESWDEFAEGKGCYLSRETARTLGVEAGDSIVVAGAELKVISAYDSREFERTVGKLDGQTLLPIDYTVQSGDRNLSLEGMETNMAAGEGVEPDPDLVFVSGDEVIIIPVSLAQMIGAELRSVAIMGNGKDSAAVARRVVESTVYPIYYGAEDGVKALVSTPLLPRAPRSLAIPILIAALIIFNTMLNSIAERRKEIYIYSSLGLAPRHIGVLFLAEAMTYGVMGSVFGYIIGQGLATVLTRFDLMGGITLNYSGSSVIMTMGLVMLVVMLSAIVPAFIAAKVASPSGDLDWKVPQPSGGAIRGQLPFTVSTKAAPGLAAFLFEYIDAHRDGAIGNFTSDNLRLEDGAGDTVVTLKATIWPAPYDLGVRQSITISFDMSEGDICDLDFELCHEAGQERSWWRLNRVFLTDIRSQLLGWRNIAPERMLKYIRQSASFQQLVAT